MCLQKSASLWHVTRRRWKNFGLWPLTPTSNQYSSLSITDGWEDNYPMKTTHPNGVSKLCLLEWASYFVKSNFSPSCVCPSERFGIFPFHHPPGIISISSPLPEAAVDLSSNGLVIFNKLLVHLLMAFLNHKPEQARLGFPLILSVAPT